MTNGLSAGDFGKATITTEITAIPFRSALLATHRDVVGWHARLIEEAAMNFTTSVARVDRIALAIGLGKHREPAPTMYHVIDRLHAGRAVDVPAHQIAPTVSAWLAELGVQSPLVDDLARAARLGDWPAAYAVGQNLSVEVTLAAAG
ncbi:hypothetical protein MLAC_23630 [Mycobacterium lacus]|uniref:Uncharacterized protein n=2 Tax=Mycobacterium lacus TaxID=169765 RepID=A0A7I7NLA9_9MYCO|nr:hypothetical protein MLAC_23630 [Mycobacterium lacus]